MQLLLEETEACEGSLCQSRISDQVRISPFKGCAAIVTTAKKKREIENSWDVGLFSPPPSGTFVFGYHRHFPHRPQLNKMMNVEKTSMHVWLSVYLKKFIEHQASCVFKHKTKHLNSTSKVGL